MPAGGSSGRVVAGLIGLVTGLVTGLGTTGCAPGATRPDLAFGPCVGLELPTTASASSSDPQLSCATLSVPIDHDSPHGPQLAVAVVRLRSAAPGEVIGSLVLNPGGPGRSGVEAMPGWAASLPADLRRRFDLVSFDPRGVGRSGPVSCGPLASDDEPSQLPDLTTAGGFAAAAADADRFAAACAKALGRRGWAYSTEATADDLELLRRALGESRLSYVGWSYGAKLGAAYAHRYPDRLRVAVLDAPSDPAADPMAVVESQVAGLERAFAAYAGDCPHRPSCRPMGEPAAFVHRLVAEAERRPIRSRRAGDHRPAGGADVVGVISGMLYGRALWHLLDAALVEAAGGDAGSLFEARDHVLGLDGDDADSRPDGLDLQYLVNCNDLDPRRAPTDAQLRAGARRLTRDAPIFGRLSSGWLLACRHWTHPGPGLPVPTAAGAPPLLVVGTTGDPVTPYAGAVSLTRSLGGSTRLLTWRGVGHTAFGQSDCVSAAVVSYLVSGTLPAEGASCPG